MEQISNQSSYWVRFDNEEVGSGTKQGVDQYFYKMLCVESTMLLEKVKKNIGQGHWLQAYVKC